MGDTSSRSCLLAGTLLVFLSLPLTAQPASLVKDINAHRESVDSGPIFLGASESTAYFTARSWEFGRELWRTDGTPEGTLPLGDRCPGYCSSGYFGLASLGGKVLIGGRNQIGVSELIALGPSPAEIETILSNASGGATLPTFADEGDFGVLGSRLIFPAYSGATHLSGIYSTDGTASGLERLATFGPERDLIIVSAIRDKLVFASYDPESDRTEFWATSGEAAGTRSIASFSGRIDRGSVSTVRDEIYFQVRLSGAVQLWVTDATSTGTSRLLELSGPSARILAISGGRSVLFFVAEDQGLGQELWSSDGTQSGTHPVTSFSAPDAFEDAFSDPTTLAVVRDNAFFFAADGVHSDSLWTASSQPGSARIVRDLCSAPRCYFSGPTVLGDRVVFSQFTSETGWEPWITDGTQGGTALLADVCPGSCDGGFELLSTRGSRFFFRATGAPAISTLFAGDLQTLQVWSLYDELRHAPLFSHHEHASAVFLGERLLFSAHDLYSGQEPWSTDSSPSGTFRLATIGALEASDSQPRKFASSGSALAFFADSDFHSNRVWVTDGTADGTLQATGIGALVAHPALVGLPNRFALASTDGIVTIDPDSGATFQLRSIQVTDVEGSGNLGNSAAFLIRTWDGVEVWRTDGSIGGTTRTYVAPQDWSILHAFRHVGNHLLFEGGPDGTQDGLYSLSAAFGSPTRLTPLESRLETLPVPENEPIAFFEVYFQATGETGIWSTDGSLAGTHEAVPLRSFRLSGATKTDLGYALLVSSYSSASSQILLIDATSGGTTINSSVPLSLAGSVVNMTSTASKVYFQVVYQNATWLWCADLSTHSATPLVQVSHESYGELNHDFFSSGTYVYFSKCDEIHGCELWVTDGTPEGTELLQDVNPGSRSSLPGDYFRVENLLYFTADDGIHGRELWVLPLDGGPACRASDTALCLENERFRIEADWWDFAGNSGRAQAMPLTADTGTFWFFAPENIELILKVLDGTGFNGHHWVLYGALSNVEYAVTITDTETGAAKRLFNPAGRFASGGDITAFGPQGAHASGEVIEETTSAGAPPEVLLAMLSAPAGLPGNCVPTDTEFCILNDRFAVSATWRDFYGNTGNAHALSLTPDTGYFWFFGPDNVEVVLKMVDGTGYNGKFWLLYGALSNVEYTLTVTDTVAGTQRRYHNPLGAFGSFGDIEAFPAP